MSMTKLAFAVFVVLFGMIARQPAVVAEQQIDYVQVVEVIERQLISTQSMTKEAILVALGVDPQRSLDRLAASRVEFGQAIVGLHDGDAALGLPAADAELREEVDRALGLWAQLDEILRASVDNAQVTADQIVLIAGISAPLLDAMTSLSEVYRKRAPGSEHFSMLVAALDTCMRQRLLSQRMTKEYLLIAYDFDPQANRQRLNQSIAAFDKALDGLIRGDLDMTLLPAPTAQIKRKLLEIEEVWESELRPLLESAADGERISIDSVAEAARISLLLMEDMSAAENLYETL